MARRSYRRLALFATLVCVVGVILGVVADRVARARRGAPDEARSLLASGETRDAETTYFRLLTTEPPTVERVVSFLDAHALHGASAHDLEHEDDDAPLPSMRLPSKRHQGAAIDEEAIDALFAREDLPPDVKLLGPFWREALEDRVDASLLGEVRRAADADPPMPWSNRLLAREADVKEDATEAGERFLREGTRVPGHASDVAMALAVYEETNDWPALAHALADPAVARWATPALKVRAAVEANDFRTAARWLLPSTFPRPRIGPLALTLVAAVAWAIFAAQLGKGLERARFRVPLYFVAFVLGVFSVALTDAFILLEESKLHLVETGEPVRDLLFFTFGVGFREELSKLILFLPLVPLLRRRGNKIDVLASGAFVGLGFAAAENLGYLNGEDLTTGIGRFLTANFLHMAMTAVIASALDDFLEHGDEHAPALSRALLLVMALHGLYDFFIAQPRLGGGFLAMGVFFLLVNQFLVAVEAARGRPAPGERLVDTFVLGIAVVAAATYVWASILVGPSRAGAALSEGMVGSFILVVAFARRLERMS